MTPEAAPIALWSGILAMLVGGGLCFVAIENRKLLTGLALLVVGGVLVWSSTATASPVDPDNPVVPITDFGKRVQAAFVGTADEADELGALHIKYGRVARFRNAITTADAWMKSFVASVQNQKEALAPFGGRLVPLSRVVDAEFQRRNLVKEFNSGQAADLWIEVGEALEAKQ